MIEESSRHLTALQAGGWKRNWAAAALGAAIAGLVEWFAAGRLGIQLVGLLVTGYYVAGSFGGAMSMAGEGIRVKWHMQRENLHRAGLVIGTKTKSSLAQLIVVVPFLFVALARGGAPWALPVVILWIPFTLWNRHVEKKFALMEADPDAAADYAVMVGDWEARRFGFKAPWAGRAAGAAVTPAATP